jgi:hypothetical protein
MYFEQYFTSNIYWRTIKYTYQGPVELDELGTNLSRLTPAMRSSKSNASHQAIFKAAVSLILFLDGAGVFVVSGLAGLAAELLVVVGSTVIGEGSGTKMSGIGEVVVGVEEVAVGALGMVVDGGVVFAVTGGFFCFTVSAPFALNVNHLKGLLPAAILVSFC